jgi:hypothetical protein
MRTPRKSTKKPTTKKPPPKPAASTASNVQLGHPPTARNAPQAAGGVVDPANPVRAAATALGFEVAKPPEGAVGDEHSPAATSGATRGVRLFRRERLPVEVSTGMVANFEAFDPGARRALSERPTQIRDAARALSREFTAQVKELKRSKPNEPDRLAKHNDLVALFEKMAAGLSNLADALDQAVNKASAGKLEPAFLGKAAKVVGQLQEGVMEWLKENRTTLIEVPIRIGLFGLGLTFVHALGVDDNLVTTLIAGLALKKAPKSAKKR